MKKSVVLAVVCLFACVVMTGCARVSVKKEFQKYTSLYVGWLDMQGWNYGAYGYLNRTLWAAEVGHLNVDHLQGYTRSYLRGWDVTGALSPRSVPPRKQGMIVVRLSNPVVNNYTMSVRCALSFYDGMNGRLLKYKVVESAPAVHYGHSRWGYVRHAFVGGDFRDAMYNLAYEIQKSMAL